MPGGSGFLLDLILFFFLRRKGIDLVRFEAMAARVWFPPVALAWMWLLVWVLCPRRRAGGHHDAACPVAGLTSPA